MPLHKSHRRYACLAQILIPFPFSIFFVDESQSQCMKSHFPSQKMGKSQFPFYPFRTLCMQPKSIMNEWIRPLSNDAGTKLCRDKMPTRFATVHMMPVRCRFRVRFFSYLNFTLITVHNIHHRQNVSSNRNQTLTVKCSHSAETVEFCYGFKLLRLAFWFQTLSVTVSHFCMPVYQVNVTPKRTVPFFKLCRHRVNGVLK